MENSHELIEKFCDTSVTYLWHIIATAPNRGLPTPKITRDFSLMLRWQTRPSHISLILLRELIQTSVINLVFEASGLITLLID